MGNREFEGFSQAQLENLSALGLIFTILILFVIYVCVPAFVGWIASLKGRSGWTWFFSSMGYMVAASLIRLPSLGFMVALAGIADPENPEPTASGFWFYLCLGLFLGFSILLAPVYVVAFTPRKKTHVIGSRRSSPFGDRRVAGASRAPSGRTTGRNRGSAQARSSAQAAAPAGQPLKPRIPSRRRSAAASKFRRR